MPEHVVLDTGPLADFLVLTYAHETDERWVLDTRFRLMGVRTPSERRKVELFFQARRGRLITTPGVVSEIEGHVREIGQACKPREAEPAFRRRFWRIALDSLSELRVREESVACLEVDSELVMKVGPVDAGLMRLTEVAPTGDPRVLLTNDQELAGMCRAREISVELTVPWLQTLPPPP